MRGDHGWAAAGYLVMPGPPPHARGPPDGGRAPGRGHGTTPACAGTTSPGSGPVSSARDHPRMRGDHSARNVGDVEPLGPPPHARGPPIRTRPRSTRDGTTPACAGTTRPRGVPPPGTGDHPRMRGDHTQSTRYELTGQGPPPHARGPPIRTRPRSTRDGTTPACAGTTRPRGVPPPGTGDHPRMRGDHTQSTRYELTGQGPPPHARGPLAGANLPITLLGTTPACAGTTRTSRRWCPSPRDHPRMRGDHWPWDSRSRARAGPPPHARGPPGPVVHRVIELGTTPACAGTTRWCVSSPNGTGDHPRMRGDHSS